MIKTFLLLLATACGVLESDPKITKDHFDAAPINIIGSSISSTPTSCPVWSVHFSPNGGATEYIVGKINSAKTSIFVQAYSFTSKPIADALIKAKARGILVEGIFDKGDKTGKGSLVEYLKQNKVPALYDCKHAIAHNKIIIIDEKIVFSGSFNLTEAAEHSNAENSIEIQDVNLAKLYYNNYLLHKQHSVAL